MTTRTPLRRLRAFPQHRLPSGVRRSPEFDEAGSTCSRKSGRGRDRSESPVVAGNDQLVIFISSSMEELNTTQRGLVCNQHRRGFLRAVCMEKGRGSSRPQRPGRMDPTTRSNRHRQRAVVEEARPVDQRGDRDLSEIRDSDTPVSQERWE